MNTKHLKYVIEVERTCSISQAAENLFMGQPTLSKIIKELEDSLGYAIFERTSRGVSPTQKGQEFLIYARNILQQIEKMEALSETANSNIQNFSISIPRAGYITDAIVKFMADLDESRGINVNVQETNSFQVINNITDGSFRLGIIRYQIEYENYFFDYLMEKQLQYEILWEFEHLALMSTNHPLAQCEKIDYEELREFTEISYGETIIPYLMQSNNSRINNNGKTSKHIYIYDWCSQYDILSTIPTTYMWGSPISEKWLTKYNLIQRRCKASGHRYKDVFIYSKDYKLTELECKFIDKLSETKNEVAFKEYR
ncbi:MAG: LysR family transcriptional regulator [Anaerocolumna aminovalerica]|uniref:LysR family transcriptional regulator n=1 Tax=Anaerocolumna aminovalerica TaxID=1527 RepID=UPI00291255F2|nr:LysR family transcriptional regulator [Anaerocolumna aminovalerica]MDU6263132.1 LysR family transcriptional regulator [Anaerocolumna aminovalerica]